MSKILVTGATGYVGGRLVSSLLEQNLPVRVFVRDAKKAESHSWSDKVEVAVGNALDFESTKQALNGVRTAFYLLHSIGTSSDYDKIEADMARNFARAAEASGVTQIVYLGGISNDKKISKHLASRANTGSELSSGKVPVLELRAGIIIGSGSASFEMLRHLTHRLPVMTTPKWVTNRTQPISIKDVLYYLTSSAKLKSPVSGIFDIGGPEVLPYEEMMQRFAKISGLRRRVIVKVPVLTPKLSSHWIGLVTPVPVSLAKPLVGSLISEVVADPAKSISKVIPEPADGLTDLTGAIKLALSNVSQNNVTTHWSDATPFPAPWQKAQSDPEWAGEMILKDSQVLLSSATTLNLWRAVEEIGGKRGWYGADFLWKLRGFIDRLIGGVGLRRGRRDPLHLRVGDSLDFWRVEEVIPEKFLRLYAEMILPGKAWLQFEITDLEDGRVQIKQEARFAPRGLGGQLYWYILLPFHRFIFPTMLRNIVSYAENLD